MVETPALGWVTPTHNTNIFGPVQVCSCIEMTVLSFSDMTTRTELSGDRIWE